MDKSSKYDKMTVLAKNLLNGNTQTTPKQLMELVRAEGKKIDLDTARAVYMRLRRLSLRAAEQKLFPPTAPEPEPSAARPSPNLTLGRGMRGEEVHGSAVRRVGFGNF